jgi:Fur family ferric uptake transcriptional regulator
LVNDGNENKKEYMTRQRRMILEELQSVVTHPSADAVYEMVRKRLPKISLGTVYRNLEQLAREGVILKLDGGTQKRYDGNPKPHHHFRCVECGDMIDLPMKPLDDIRKIIHSLAEFEITSYELEFTGLCPKCKQAKE